MFIDKLCLVLDLSSRDERVLQMGVQLAGTHHIEANLVTVLIGGEGAPGAVHEVDGARERPAQRNLEERADRLRALSDDRVSTTCHVRFGPLAEELRAHADEHDADVVVIAVDTHVGAASRPENSAALDAARVLGRSTMLVR